MAATSTSSRAMDVDDMVAQVLADTTASHVAQPAFGEGTTSADRADMTFQAAGTAPKVHQAFAQPPRHPGMERKRIVCYDAEVQTEQTPIASVSEGQAGARPVSPMREGSLMPELQAAAIMQEDRFTSFLSSASRSMEAEVTRSVGPATDFSDAPSTSSRSAARGASGIAAAASIFDELHFPRAGPSAATASGVTSTSSYSSIDASGIARYSSALHAPSLTDGRPVADMQWSPHHPEMLVASYHMPSIDFLRLGGTLPPSTAPDESSTSTGTLGAEAAAAPLAASPGLVLVWSTRTSGRPECILTAPDPVTCVRFHPFDRRRVVGGTASGQIVIWDMASSKEPIACSARSTEGSHIHPIASILFTGNAHTAAALTTSIDGRFCQWSLKDVAKPTLSKGAFRGLPLGVSTGAGTGREGARPVLLTTCVMPLPYPSSGATGSASAVASVGYSHASGVCEDVKRMVACTEDGSLAVCRLDGANYDCVSRLRAHYASITTLATAHAPRHAHGEEDATSTTTASSGSSGGVITGRAAVDASGVSAASSSPACLVLDVATGSQDGSVRLWTLPIDAPEPKPSLRATIESFAGPVADVAFCPAGQLRCAAIDQGGYIHIVDGAFQSPPRAVPDARTPQVHHSGLTTIFSLPAGQAGTKLCWSPDGRQLLTGDVSGRLHVLMIDTR